MYANFTPLRNILKSLALLAVLLYPSFGFAVSDTNDLKDIGIDEKLGDLLPMDAEFLDEEGKSVKLEDFFQEGKPVILSLVYYGCPRICTFASNGVAEAVNGLSSISLGKDFKILTVSFDSLDTTALAKEKAAASYKQLQTEHTPKGNWRFLTGNAENIAKLTEAVGFKFKKDGEEFAHPSALVMLTPVGKISRYLYGIQYETKDVKLALIEAANGKIGSSELLNRVMLFCYEFDPVGKKYALQALNVVKAGGLLTLLTLTGFLTYYWKREKKS